MKKSIANTLLVLSVLAGLLSNMAVAESRFTMPEYEKFSLNNGLTVYLLEHHEVPLIYTTTVFPVGSVDDGEKFGLAGMTADALLFGTETYSKQQIDDIIDFLGASLSTSASKEATRINLSFAAKDLDPIVPVWREIIQSPRFDEAEFTKYKERRLVELEQARERPGSVIGTYFGKFIFADHPYGNPTTGTRPSVASITVDDVQEFYSSRYTAGEAAIIVAGDFNSSDMKTLIRREFGSWNNGENQNRVMTSKMSLPRITESRVLLVNKEDSRQTTFLIGGLGIKRSNPDYVAIQVINTILGGRFTSWLNDELRVNSGLTYGARSGFSPYRDSGLFYISSFTATPTTEQAIDLALHVLDSLHTSGIDEATLMSAKKYINGQFPPRYETAGALAGLMADMFIYNFDESYINDFQKKVNDLTLDRAKGIIEKYFPKENLQFVLIGQGSAIEKVAAKYGPLIKKEITAQGF